MCNGWLGSYPLFFYICWCSLDIFCFEMLLLHLQSLSSPSTIKRNSMEGGIGDYIYLIVILIAGVSAILKKQKKKAEQLQKEKSLPDGRDVYTGTEDFMPFDTDFWGDPIPIKEKPVVNTVKDTATLKTNKPQYVPVKSPKKTVLKDESDTDQLLDISLEDADDAKKAFIYAEIFNRKYV